MIKSGRVILSVLVVSVMAIAMLNSCGRSNPAGGPSSTNPANTNLSAFSSFAPGPKLTPLPDWMMNLPPASISCLLANPHSSPNASGAMKPFNQLCGDYYYRVQYARGAIATAADTQSGTCGVLGCSAVEKWGIYEIGGPGSTVARQVFLGLLYQCYDPCKAGLVTTLPPNPDLVAKLVYTIRCDDPCFLGGNFPSDAFTGSGFPAGKYIGGDGSIYDFTPGTPPTVTPPDPNKPRALLGVIITPDTASISVGEMTSFMGMAVYSKPPVVETVTNAINSQNPNAATIANGVVTGINEGHADLTLTVSSGAVTYGTFSYVDVTLGVPTSVVIEPASATMLIGDKYTFKAFAVYPNNKRVDVSAVYGTTWTSGDVSIATIAGGVVAAVASGSTPVSATFKGVTGTATLDVIEIPPLPDTVQITPLNASIAQGETQQFIATAIYPNRSIDITTDPNITWTAGDMSKATIDSSGLARGLAPGQSFIWCNYKNVQSSSAAMLNVTPPIMTINITYTPANPQVYDIVHLLATGTYSDPNIPPVNLDKLAEFSSDNIVVTGLSNTSFPFFMTPQFQALGAGTVTITAKWTTPYGQVATGTVSIYVAERGNTRGTYNFLQVEPLWKDDLYANYTTSSYPNPIFPLDDTGVGQGIQIQIYSGTIGAKGCLMTSVAMGLSDVGAYINPQNLNIQMKNAPPGMPKPTYYIGNEVDYFALQDFSKGNITNVRTGATVSEIKAELDKGNVVITQVPFRSTGCGHWLRLRSYNGNIYYGYDPTFGDRNLTTSEFCGQIWVGEVKK